jgi:acyl-CoA synthetase (AMP-forming)/AMP-acid ligase II
MRRLEQDQGAAYEEIGFDGWNKFLGYTGRGEHHGVFWTGDLGYLDAKGNLVYLGRSISVIKSGGENISCLEVEVALQEILGEECESVFVVGIPDPNWGEAAIALVKSRDASGSLVSRLLQAEVLRAECRRVLAGYKIPRKFVAWEGEWPLTVTGKIDREALRRWAVTNGQLVIASGMG